MIVWTGKISMDGWMIIHVNLPATCIKRNIKIGNKYQAIIKEQRNANRNIQ
jgi:hypothetical protein